VIRASISIENDNNNACRRYKDWISTTTAHTFSSYSFYSSLFFLFSTFLERMRKYHTHVNTPMNLTHSVQKKYNSIANIAHMCNFLQQFLTLWVTVKRNTHTQEVLSLQFSNSSFPIGNKRVFVITGPSISPNLIENVDWKRILPHVHI